MKIKCPKCDHEQDMNEDFLDRNPTVMCEVCMQTYPTEDWVE